MKKIKNIFPAFIVIVFMLITFFSTSCDDYKSEEFEISSLDLQACQQLKSADSLGADTVTAILLSDIDTSWVMSSIYDTITATYNNVNQILDSLVAKDIVITNTTQNKLKLITRANKDTSFFALQSNSTSLTFFFDTSVSINFIDPTGKIINVNNNRISLETASGCTKLDDKDVEIPLIIARYEISVPSNPVLWQLIKNEQTESHIIHVSIL